MQFCDIYYYTVIVKMPQGLVNTHEKYTFKYVCD